MCCYVIIIAPTAPHSLVLTLIAIISHPITRLKSSPQKRLCMLLLYLTPPIRPTHIKPDSQMVQSTAFSEWVERRRKSTLKANSREYYTHSFSHRHASRFLCSIHASHTNPPAHFCLFSIPHSNVISHATHHHRITPQPPPASLTRKALMLFSIYNSTAMRRSNRQANSNERGEHCNNNNMRTEVWQC